MFQFKKFSIDQNGCAMKINTDGVLLGAMAAADGPQTILDIGTGTGVIALMLAQRFTRAKIDAVEIDLSAAETAERNFKTSPFADLLQIYPVGFELFFKSFPDKKYDLIASNPPFYIDSLKSPAAKKTLAKHTDIDFFERLILDVSMHLTSDGNYWLIIPVNIAEVIIPLAADKGLFPAKMIWVKSYEESRPHRVILCLGYLEKPVEVSKLTIYQAEKIYSQEYKNLLQPYFLTF